MLLLYMQLMLHYFADGDMYIICDWIYGFVLDLTHILDDLEWDKMRIIIIIMMNDCNEWMNECNYFKNQR